MIPLSRVVTAAGQNATATAVTVRTVVVPGARGNAMAQGAHWMTATNPTNTMVPAVAAAAVRTMRSETATPATAATPAHKKTESGKQTHKTE